MPEPLADQFGKFAVGQEVGRVAMPEVMEANARQFRALDDAAEIPTADVVRVKRLAVRLAEDQTVVVVVVAEQAAILFLLRLQPAQFLDQGGQERGWEGGGRGGGSVSILTRKWAYTAFMRGNPRGGVKVWAL